MIQAYVMSTHFSQEIVSAVSQQKSKRKFLVGSKKVQTFRNLKNIRSNGRANGQLKRM